MNITLFGATGKTGQHVLRHALSQGHTVKAYVRSPQKITATSDRLEVVTGEYNDTASIAAVVTDADADKNDWIKGAPFIGVAR